jgi:hypothetical protein
MQPQAPSRGNVSQRDRWLRTGCRTGGPQSAYLKDGFNGYLNAMLKPIQRGMLNFTGFSVLQTQVVYGPVRVEDGQRKVWLAQWEQRLRDIESEAAIEIGGYCMEGAQPKVGASNPVDQRGVAGACNISLAVRFRKELAP